MMYSWKELKGLKYPFNLMCDAFEVDVDDVVEHINNVSDFDKSLEYVLSNLSDKERLTLEYRYKKRMSYQEIGDVFNITRERVRQYKVRAFKKLRKSHLTKYLRYGMLGVERMKNNKSTMIEELKLSTRAYSILKRHGINTLEQLLTLNYHDILTMRNMGRKSTEEIVEKVKFYGYEIKK